jgi:hypothetical protein
MSQIINDMQASKTCGKCKSLKSNTDFKVRKNGSVNKTCESCLNPRRKNKTKIENESNVTRENIRENIKKDFLSTFPDEILYIISENLKNVRDLVSLSCTNKRFNRICKDSKFDNEHNVLYTKIKISVNTMIYTN